MSQPTRPTQQKPSNRRVTQSQTDHVYELGVAGRKTGITLEDKGFRDEYGMEDPDIFSSPGKSNGDAQSSEDDDDEGVDMEIDNGSDMGPATIRKQRNRLSLPRGRSPPKTNLQSPARQNPHLGPNSSPTRGDIREEHHVSPHKSAVRRLDFSTGPDTQPGKKTLNGHKTRLDPPTSRVNGIPEDVSEEEVDEDDDEGDDYDQVENIDAGEDEPEPEPEPEPLEVPTRNDPPPKKRGRKPKQVEEPVEEQDDSGEPEEPISKKGQGRPKAGPATASKPTETAGKRKGPGKRLSVEAEEDTAPEESNKRQKVADKQASREPSAKPAAPATKGKPGRKRKSSGIGMAEPVVQRGPPLPKVRGLVSMRREGPDGMQLTRSGRHSFKPLEFWMGDRYEKDYETVESEKRTFMVPATKGIIRHEQPEEVKKAKRPRAKAGRPKLKGRASATIYEEEVEREDWETETGHKVGECLQWLPEYEHNPPDPEEGDYEAEMEELAVSEAAIQPKAVKDATFLFAKTHTTPFFGTGILDLPPHSQKRRKNARRMLMAFFVHTGSVEVTVATTTFRIGKGGQFNVPRGNYYSILNDSETSARIFFAQGCEQVVELGSQEM